MKRAPPWKSGSRALANDDPAFSPDDAASLLNGYHAEERGLLDALLLPPDSLEGSPDTLLEHVRLRACEAGLGAWDAVGWLIRLNRGFIVDDLTFTRCREGAVYAPPVIQASWLKQWRRPEIWLAALDCNRPPDSFPPLLNEVLSGAQSPGAEALAALLHCALESADARQFQEDHHARLQGVQEEAAPWGVEEWPILAEQMARDLVERGAEIGLALATEMLIYGHIRRDPPRHPVIAQVWNQQLAAQLPNSGFERLLANIAMRGERGGTASALTSAALAAIVPMEDGGRAERVWETYCGIPVSVWQGRKGVPELAEDETEDRLPGLLGACLAQLDSPGARWEDSWLERYPGPPEGWNVDIAEWRASATASAHLELVGLLASLEPPVAAGQIPALRDAELFQRVVHRVHERLYDAASKYVDADLYVLKALWAVGGESLQHRTWKAIPDHWVANALQAYDPDSIRFQSLESTGSSR